LCSTTGHEVAEVLFATAERSRCKPWLPPVHN
jgi:hypothetical protein